MLSGVGRILLPRQGCVLSRVVTFREKGCPVALQGRVRHNWPTWGLPGCLCWEGWGRRASGSCWILHFSVEQKLSGSHKALVEMQDVVAELLRTVPREHPATKVSG